MEVEMLEPVVLASKHKFLKAGFLAYISQYICNFENSVLKA